MKNKLNYVTFETIPEKLKSKLLKDYVEYLQANKVQVDRTMTNGLKRCYEVYSKANEKGFKIYELHFKDIVKIVNDKIDEKNARIGTI